MGVLRRHAAQWCDATTCALLNLAQWRHRRDTVDRASLEAYLAACEDLDRPAYFRAPPLVPVEESPVHLRWPSPHASDHAANDLAAARLFPGPDGWRAPTVIILHALMSVSDRGHATLARRFHELGWSAVLLHLPFHHARRPRGYLNGELAMTAHLIRNGESLRQGVSELRQLMAWLRARGCREFGIHATSYGAWVGALLASVEQDISFIALLLPIADVEHAIWTSPAGATIRRLVRSRGIDASHTRRHAHLSSPLHGRPSTDPRRIVMATGDYDLIAPADRVAALSAAWGGARLLASPQGHFGYVAARDLFAATRGILC